MKVKEYLVNRILDLERELKQVRNEYAGVSYELSRRDNVINEQKKLIDDFQIEREHIKQIITCNIDCFDNFDNINLNTDNDDFHRLLSILDIKQEDYEIGVHHNTEPEDVKPEDKYSPPDCWGCKYEELEGNKEPCINCFQGDKKEVTPDGEAKD